MTCLLALISWVSFLQSTIVIWSIYDDNSLKFNLCWSIIVTHKKLGFIPISPFSLLHFFFLFHFIMGKDRVIVDSNSRPFAPSINYSSGVLQTHAHKSSYFVLAYEREWFDCYICEWTWINSGESSATWAG